MRRSCIVRGHTGHDRCRVPLDLVRPRVGHGDVNPGCAFERDPIDRDRNAFEIAARAGGHGAGRGHDLLRAGGRRLRGQADRAGDQDPCRGDAIQAGQRPPRKGPRQRRGHAQSQERGDYRQRGVLVSTRCGELESCRHR